MNFIKRYFKDGSRVLTTVFATVVLGAATIHLWPENWALLTMGIWLGMIILLVKTTD